jgi:hypothetical protein
VHSRGKTTARRLAALAMIAVAAGLVGACSPGAEYPAVLDKPPPHADQTLSPDEVKQATDALISDRNQLSTQAQAAQQSAPATTGSTPVAGAAAKP